MDQIVRWLDQHHVNAVTVGVTVVVLLIAAVAILLVNRLLRRWLRVLDARFRLPYETATGVTRVVSTTLWMLTILFVMDLWGVGFGGLWTLLASAATVVGVGFLATWAMISNVTASLFLTLWRPFSLGDGVEMLPENVKGRVIDRNLMFTSLREDDGGVLQIPNNLFFQKMFRVTDRGERFLFEELNRNPAARTGRDTPVAPDAKPAG